MMATTLPSGDEARVAANPVLAVHDLRTYFFTADGVVRAVEGMSFTVRAGETLGIVGESGCGKSVTALSVLQLIPPQQGRIVSGSIAFDGRDLVGLSEDAMRKIRGNAISMIFQEPMTSLNPVLSVGFQIAEAVRLHQTRSWRVAKDRAIEMLERVRIPDAARRANEYPHQFSGGMRQRAMIAMALACNPRVLIADEPTTALDVTIQAQILELIVDLQREFGTAVILITHNFGVVAETADRVIVMYAGRKVEESPTRDLFRRPLHPYTRGLMESIPSLDGPILDRLSEIPGLVPSLDEDIPGCAFAPRCRYATDRCRAHVPPLERHGEDHWAACFEVERVETQANGGDLG